jgi:nucleotide-binding universal stress UspA family protein
MEEATGRILVGVDGSANSTAALRWAVAEADLVVLGTRGLGGFRGLLLGSVTHQVAHHVGCPIVVVP